MKYAGTILPNVAVAPTHSVLVCPQLRRNIYNAFLNYGRSRDSVVGNLCPCLELNSFLIYMLVSTTVK
jgi:hypothetical protein